MVQFSSRMSQLKGSAIRELLALANKPEVLSFAGGMPAPVRRPIPDEGKNAGNAPFRDICVFKGAPVSSPPLFQLLFQLRRLLLCIGSHGTPRSFCSHF